MTNNNVNVRLLHEDDWQTLRAIRLEALQTDPHAFGSTFEREAEFSEGDWRSWLATSELGIFGIFKGATLIGMTGVRLIPEGREASLWGSWIRPDERGAGLSRLLYEARFGWARETGQCDAITVSHRASNIASREANQKHGFVYTHTTMTAWPDGQAGDQLFYRLALSPLDADVRPHPSTAATPSGRMPSFPCV